MIDEFVLICFECKEEFVKNGKIPSRHHRCTYIIEEAVAASNFRNGFEAGRIMPAEKGNG